MSKHSYLDTARWLRPVSRFNPHTFLSHFEFLMVYNVIQLIVYTSLLTTTTERLANFMWNTSEPQVLIVPSFSQTLSLPAYALNLRPLYNFTPVISKKAVLNLAQLQIQLFQTFVLLL